MGRIVKLSVVIVAVALLSGCSPGNLLPGGKNKSSGKSGSIWKSYDGGNSFSLKAVIEAPVVPAEDAKKTKKTEIKPKIITSDILAFAFHPFDSNIIYVGTVNDGIFKTENGGSSWKHINFPPKRIDSFTLDRNQPDRIMFASGTVKEMSKIFRTEDGGEGWKEVYTEPGAKTAITAMSQNNIDTRIIFAGTSGGTIIKSEDGGSTWKNVGQGIQGKVTALPFDFASKDSVYALSFAKQVFYSKNGGESWIDWEAVKKEELKKMKEEEKKYRKKRDISKADRIKERIEFLESKNKAEKMPPGIVSIVTSPFVSGVIYAGTQRGELYLSVDYGKYWKKLNIIESASKFPIRMITLSHADKNDVSFVSERAFYRSRNGGVSWAVAQLNVDRPISVISYDPGNSNNLYLGLSRQYDELKQ